MTNQEKFQKLLREIFQHEHSNLDFGVYRILNYKRKEIENFIQNELNGIVEEAFGKHKSSITENVDREFEQAKQKIIENFGKDAITFTGDIKDEFKNTPLGKRYLEIKARKEEADKIDEIKLQVFNDLYNFFSRYYEEGDFVPQYRYSIKGHKYAIPYNGEEVKLYWANSDQYYIKTGLLFQDYSFKVGDYRVVFRTETAEEELSTNKQKEKQRRFVLSDKGLEIDETKKEVVIYFNYRLLSNEEIKNLKEKIKDGNGNNKNGENDNNESKKEQTPNQEKIKDGNGNNKNGENDNNESKKEQTPNQEKIKDGNGNNKNGENDNNESKKEQTPKQENINQVIFEEIKEILKNQKQFHLFKELIENTKNEKPVLLYQINRFTAKNTMDFFIHKNLKRFLEQQLDYFIKAEVLDIKTLEEEKYLDKHITRAKTVREIGEKIIDFLSQIEEFQKRLWEKKKFVIKTDYVITLDRIKEWTDEKFYKEVIETVLKNEGQLKEWEELGFGKIEKEKDLIDKKLPIDTRYFDEEFKFKLLEKISEKKDLEDVLDGVLIKSENWQGLNTILNKYREKVQTIYIDPPYNTGSDEFLYRDRYQHSSWLTMMENRLSLARELMRDDGVIFVSIGDTVKSNIRVISSSKLVFLLDNVFGEDNFIALLVRKSGIAPRQDIKHIAIAHDFVVCYGKNFDLAKINKRPVSSKRYNMVDEYIETRGKFALNKLDRGSIHYSRNLVYPIIAPDGTEIWPGGEKGGRKGWTWRWSKDKVEWGIKNGFIVFRKGKNGNWLVYFKEYEFVDNEGNPKERTNPYDTFIMEATNEKGNEDIENLFRERLFEYPKPVLLLELLLKISGTNNSLILDFFAGSGTTAHAVMKLNQEDGGKRKFILVEMADYFYTVIIPRLKKVAYSFNWKDGKPQDTNGIGVFFKYHTLEQYEDALDNIELKENQKAQELFKDEYLLKYFLDFETRESEYLLNIEKLKNPFAYKLKINEGTQPKEVIVDIPETFNYLLGLKVKKIKVRYNEGKKYLFILGEKEGRDYAVVWREYQDNWTEEYYKKDKEFIKQELKEYKPQVVYINGQSVLTQNFDDFQAEIRYIETDFKRLMES